MISLVICFFLFVCVQGQASWSQVTQNGNIPSPRYDFSSIYYSSQNQIVVFGGLGNASEPSQTIPTNTLARFDTGSSTWSNSGARNPPSVRYLHSAAFASNPDQMIVFAGAVYSNLLNDTYSYNLASDSWSVLNPVGSIPARAGHSAVVSQNIMYVFGGMTSDSTCTNDLYKLDIQANKWTMLQADDQTTKSTTQPSPRRGHSAVITSDNKMIIFGGYVPLTGQEVSDVWEYDIGSGSWSQVSASGSGPIARDTPGATIANSDTMYIWGGLGGDYLNDFYALSNNKWTSLSQSSAPPARRGLCFVSSGDTVWLFAGRTNALVYQDMWTSTLPTVSSSLSTRSSIAITVICLIISIFL